MALRSKQWDGVVPSMGVAAHRDDGREVLHVELVDALVPRTQAAVGETGIVEPFAEQPQAPQRVLLLDDEDGLHEGGR